MKQFVIKTVPEPAGRERAQEQITQICGVNEFDEPLLRLEWGGTERRWLAGDWRAKYRAPGTTRQTRLLAWVQHHLVTGAQTILPATAKAPDAAKDCLVLPWIEESEQTDGRWYLAEWIPPEKLGETPESWERRRWVKDKIGAPLDVLGEFPNRGQYRGVARLAGPQGEFVAADDPRVIAYAQKLWQLHTQLAATKGYWRDFMSRTEVEQTARDVWDGIQADQIEQYAELREEIASEVAPHAHRVLGNPRVILGTP